MEFDKPAQTKQPSRKGKKTWRKHIDIDDIQEGLEESRKLERQYGTKDITKVQADDIFTVDTKGDEHLNPKSVKNVKPLKTDEILARKSRVPPLVAPHKKADKPKSKAKKEVEGVSGKEINRLMRVAGRDGDSTTKASVEKEGIISTPTYDLWGDDEPKKAKVDPNPSRPKPSKAPKTITERPLQLVSDDLAQAVVIPESGKSYNPDHEEWMRLLKQESEREEQRDKERQKLAEQKQRIEELMEEYKKEVDDSDDDEEHNSSDDNKDDEDNGQLKSINQPVQVKKKSKTQRKKQEQEKDREQLQKHLKELKQQIRDLESLPKLIESEMEKFKVREAERAASEGKSKQVKKLGKHKLKDAPLEIKLSDELTDTLRRLKPEGNLVSDRFRSLQQRGLVETRVPVAKKRKYAPKITEKWSFKDFK